MMLFVEKPVASEAVGLAACLDWLCLHVANDELPASLKEHKAKEGLKVGQVIAPQPGSRSSSGSAAGLGGARATDQMPTEAASERKVR